ncbi:PREDICTED: neurofilament medium polypeptide-like [Camelina sativa]|uniref:Neurofilament medium polypeptide-like n=1 Tax=Camelina sativa TaxID=90675 RepID=A0ABM0XGI2_CAMSA|nr:PREDICTED: neurofilament medium polypeptide-like [Camelina sativa]
MARSLKKSVKLSLRHVRIRSSTIRFKPESSSIERDQRIEFLGGDKGIGEEENDEGSSSEYEEFEEEEEGEAGEAEEQDDGKSVVRGGESEGEETEAAVETAEAEAEITEAGNRVMVVVDKVIASTGALEWALKHTLQSQDYLFLLYFSKPFKKGKRKNRKQEVKTDELVHTLKKLCQTKRPGMEVEIRRLEGKEKEKGEKIVEEAKEQQVSLLVVGEEKKPPVWRLLKRWGWKKRRGQAGVLKYCLEKASCMTIAVKPKNRKLGGYLITTKRHKNFWLLA